MNLLNRLKKIEKSLIPHQTSLPIVLHLGSKRAWVDSTEYSTLQDAKQANPASIGVYSVTDIDTVYLLLKTFRGEIPGYSGNHEEWEFNEEENNMIAFVSRSRLCHNHTVVK